VERSALRRNEARVGRTEQVLVEGPSRKGPETMTARTRQGKPVHVAAGAGLRPGALATVRITHGAPHHLLGELVEVTAAPRHRSRIPVSAR
jgi:tRNA-2-methylthio-N6-dimethylallyladenosine synthase